MVKAARQLDPNDDVFEKHRNKEFQWVLSLPAPDLDRSTDNCSTSGDQDCIGDGKRRYFGCNLLDWTKPPGAGHRLPGDPEDKYILLATPIDLQADQSTPEEVEFTTHQFQIVQDHTQNSIKMTASPLSQSPLRLADAAHRPSPVSATSTQWSTIPEASEDDDNTLSSDAPHKVREASLRPAEDCFDELQRAEVESAELKDELDAITAAASQMSLNKSQSERASVSTKHQGPSSTTGVRQRLPMIESGQKSETRSTAQETNARRDISESTVVSSPETSLSETSQQQVDQDVGRKPPTATLRRVARPASLAPPKPFQKSHKQPTYSAYELPGEKVARELKEKKAARLSMQFDPQKADEATPPQRTRSIRSSKPPTVADFELPGERLSRQKKERFEQKLKEQEEQARERRQFKARPSPASASPTVRSTFTSRQRQTPGQSEQSNVYSPSGEYSARAGASKRQSVTMTPSAARTVSASSATTASATGRGRTSSAGSTKASTRATSSSVSSVASDGKHTSVPAKAAHQQKLSGRQIYNRDNSKEQDKRDREESIRLAREKYAQRSRTLAATSRARRQQQSSSNQEDTVVASPKGAAPQVPKHRDLYTGKNF